MWLLIWFDSSFHHFPKLFDDYCVFSICVLLLVNTFHVNGLFQYALKISENPLRGYRKRPVASNGIMILVSVYYNSLGHFPSFWLRSRSLHLTSSVLVFFNNFFEIIFFDNHFHLIAFLFVTIRWVDFQIISLGLIFTFFFRYFKIYFCHLCDV